MYFNEESAKSAVKYFAEGVALLNEGKPAGYTFGYATGRVLTAFVPEELLRAVGDELSRNVDRALSAVDPEGPRKLREFTRAMGL